MGLVMRAKWTFSLLIGTLLSCPQNVWADALHIITGTTETQNDETATGDTNIYQSNGTPFSFTNNYTLTSQNGYVLHLNGTDPLPATSIVNTGNMLVSGTGLNAGYGIFSTVYRGRPVSADIENYGTIERIQLKETDGSILNNYGTIGGTVLIGDNAYISNSGNMVNKTTGDDDDNIISFGKNGVLNNGDIHFATGVGEDKYDILPSTNNTLSTDNLIFTQNGVIHNGGTIQNKSIEMGENAFIHNYMSPYEGETDDTMVRQIETDVLTVGNNSSILNNMGGIFNVNNTFTTGANTTIINGSEYELELKAPKIEISIPSKEENGEPTVVEVEYPANNKVSSMNVGNLILGEANNLQNLNAAEMTGENISFQNDSSFINQGGNITLTAPAATEENPNPVSSITFLNNGSFNSQSITSTYKQIDFSTGNITSTLNLNKATTEVDEWTMGDNATIDLVGAEIISNNLTMGDNASITGEQFSYTNQDGEENFIDALLDVENTISLGNNGLIASEGLNIQTNKILFQDKGTFENSSSVVASELTMGNEATITTSGELKVPTTVGSTSRVYLYSSNNDETCDQFGECRGGSIMGALRKAEGSTDVQVVSSVESSYYGYLSGIIDVDSILLEKNSLQLSGDIKGVINMNSDTYLKFVGESVYIHDPIQRVEGATNTNLEIALDDTLPGDRPFYETTNTVDVDHILISSGGLSITRPVNVQDITLGANAILKVKGDYVTGDITELDEEAVNTTFTIDVGTGNIFNSSGTITLDRVTLDSGIFNVNHTIRAIKGLHPGNQEEGIELGTDTVLNINHDVYTNQLVRLSDATTPVTNTTVNLNQGTLTVDRNMDVDTLAFNGGHLKMNNKDLTNKVTVTNSVTVNNGSILSGNGMFEITNGDLTLDNGSTLAVSTQKVDEEALNVMNLMTDVTTISGSTIDLRATETDSDRISIAGTLNLGDNTKLIIRNITPGQEYEIISADSIIGSPDYFLTSFLWDNPIFRVENNSIYATVNGLKNFQEAISPVNPSVNVKEVAKALDTINSDLAADATIPTFLDKVTYADSAQTAAAMMKQLSSESYNNTHMAALRTLSVVNRNTMNVLSEIRKSSDKFTPQQKTVYNTPYYMGRSGGDYYVLQNGRYTLYSVDSTNENYAPPQSYRTDAGGVWVKPYALMMSQDDNKGISGYDYDAYGITAGFDVSFDTLSLGLMGVFGQGDLEQNDNNFKSDIDTYGLGIYGEILPGGHHFIDFYASYLVNTNDTQRKIMALNETATSSFDMTTYSGGAAYGYNIEIGKHVVLIPKVGIDYAYINSDEFTEKGSSAALKLKNEAYQSIQTPLEITALFNLGTQDVLFTPELKARWAHEFGDTEASNKSQFLGYTPWMKAEGIEIDRDIFTLGAAATLTLGGQDHFSLRYDYDFGSTFDAHNINLQYTHAF